VLVLVERYTQQLKHLSEKKSLIEQKSGISQNRRDRLSNWTAKIQEFLHPGHNMWNALASATQDDVITEDGLFPSTGA
jgi:hypothetical protein